MTEKNYRYSVEEALVDGSPVIVRSHLARVEDWQANEELYIFTDDMICFWDEHDRGLRPLSGNSADAEMTEKFMDAWRAARRLAADVDAAALGGTGIIKIGIDRSTDLVLLHEGGTDDIDEVREYVENVAHGDMYWDVTEELLDGEWILLDDWYGEPVVTKADHEAWERNNPLTDFPAEMVASHDGAA